MQRFISTRVETTSTQTYTMYSTKPRELDAFSSFDFAVVSDMYIVLILNIFNKAQ
jgi:hypothetical protein